MKRVGGVIPRRVLHPQTDKPAVQHVVAQLLAQQPFAADSVQPCSTRPRSNHSGGTEYRSRSSYIDSNNRSMSRSARFKISRIATGGCPSGTKSAVRRIE